MSAAESTPAAGSVARDFRPIAKLAPYARNARTHSAEQVSELVASISEFGWTTNVLVDSQGIIAGHGRIMAAAKIYAAGGTIKLPNGEPIPAGTVPVTDCTGWTDKQRRAYILADNRLALNAEWDDAILAEELKALAAEEFDVRLLGFDDKELEKLMKAATQPVAPSEFTEVDESVATNRCCPSCGYKWSDSGKGG